MPTVSRFVVICCAVQAFAVFAGFMFTRAIMKHPPMDGVVFPTSVLFVRDFGIAFLVLPLAFVAGFALLGRVRKGDINIPEPYLGILVLTTLVLCVFFLNAILTAMHFQYAPYNPGGLYLKY